MGRTRDITDRAHNAYIEARGRQTVTQKCGLCDKFEVEGPFAETRVLAEAHRRENHPEAKQRTRLVRSRAGIRTIGTKSLEENVALNRLQGASGWASVEGAMEA
jgi:hypothetical protein